MAHAETFTAMQANKTRGLALHLVIEETAGRKPSLFIYSVSSRSPQSDTAQPYPVSSRVSWSDGLLGILSAPVALHSEHMDCPQGQRESPNIYHLISQCGFTDDGLR